jgi:hypothetical protein
MKKFKILSTPARVSDVMSFDDLYDEMSSDWELKAERLQTRRWKKLRQQTI